ncbi:hypothetical protein C0993_010240 [Termitomyces sp. T159_Od127]|nr:hypothetical protein C0993_010240 [Termitomyces sp. T159_Od127]
MKARPEKPWKEKLTLRIPSKAAPKLDLLFKKVPALNEDHIVPVQATEKCSLQEIYKDLDRMIEKLWEAPVPISTKELLTVAPGLREAMVQKLVPKPLRPKEPNVSRTTTQHIVAVEKEPNKVDIGDLPGATYFIADGTQAGLPTGAVVHQDCVATYLEKIPPGEKPVVVYVARELQVLCLLNPIINRKDRVEAILDSGSQIVCMALREALELGFTWDPDIRLCMESANQQVNESVGSARNVPFTFAEGFTVYLQVVTDYHSVMHAQHTF